MEVRVRCHVFGHDRRYRTICASKSISREDIALLEQFIFGQTNDPEYLNSLNSEPGLIGRPLPSNQFALTFVIPGKPDQHSRVTLTFVSLLFDRHFWAEQGAALLLEITNLKPWKLVESGVLDLTLRVPSRSPATRDADIPAVQSTLELLSSSSSTSVRLDDSGFRLAELQELLIRMSPAQRWTFSFAFKSLTQRTPFRLNVTHAAARPKASPVVTTIADHSAGQQQVQTRIEEDQEMLSRTVPILVPSLIGAVLILQIAALFTGKSTSDTSGAAVDDLNRINQIQDTLNRVQQAVGQVQQNLPQLEQIREIATRIDDQTSGLDNAVDNATASLRGRITDVETQLRALRDALAGNEERSIEAHAVVLEGIRESQVTLLLKVDTIATHTASISWEELIEKLRDGFETMENMLQRIGDRVGASLERDEGN